MIVSWFWLVASLLQAFSAFGDEIARVRIHECAGAARRGQVVSVGVLAARGVVRDGGRWSVEAGSSRKQAQGRTLVRWPDGSVRLARVVFPVSVGAGRRRTVKIFHRAGQDDRVLEPLAWRDEDRVRARTDRLELLIPPEIETVFAGLADRRRGLIRFSRAATGTGGGPGRIDIEEEGPWRAVVRQSGAVASVEGGAEVVLDRRVTVAAGADWVDVETRVGCSSRRGTDVSVDLVLETSSPVRAIDGLRPPGLPWAIGVDRRGRAASPAVSDGRFVLSVAGSRLGVAVEGVTRLVPWRLELRRPRRLAVGLVSDEYHWWNGVRPSRLIRVGVGKRAPPPPRSLVVERHEDGGVAAAPRHPAGDRIQGILERELDRNPSFVDWLGEENSGDWRWSRSDAGNHEYDTIFGLRRAGLGLGRPDLIAAAHRALRHLVRRDLDLAGTGLPLRHGPHHRLGGVELGHVWLEGPLAAAIDETDGFVWEDLMSVIEGWRDRVDGADVSKMLTRSLGWGLLAAAVVAGFTGAPADLSRLDSLREVLTSAPGGDFFLLERVKDEEHLRRVSTWVSAGIVGEAVWRANLVRRHAAARSRFIACCRRLAREGWDRREGRLHKTLVVDERDGSVVDRAGIASGEEMLFFALGLLRARALGGEVELESVAEEVLRLAPDRLRLERKTFRGMEISQLLWLHPRLFGWRD